MPFTGFTESDFDVFIIDGLEDRMEALKKTVRPKLEELGQFFSPTLSSLTGNEMFPHVAKHARRTKNPPNDTWVAFAANPRGYKMMPHFQIGLWKTHLFIWFAVIYEADNKSDYGKTLKENTEKILHMIPGDFVWSMDHTKPGAVSHDCIEKEELQTMFTKLQSVKKAEILCGFQIPREKAVKMDADLLLKKIDSVFRILLPLYKMA
ncbi:DUF1054 domain-containing protein [Mesobacillus zeae]|uniref:UPF0637 protein D1970_03175 n=1 Tax=Mesobacillus zeae TaxID=1917180 RepID=A0A398BKF0_9BACI|nr:DUF1054 domain-containing protein [Mesobacillus zeae]RID87853.1 DUF1054 domain-containing protein [Mesobacillus zeae]